MPFVERLVDNICKQMEKKLDSIEHLIYQNVRNLDQAKAGAKQI